ncbi:hypothetical protein P7C65_01s1g00670 [Encephalitozoon intestinalis]|nr:hypothetical protein GPK93_01g00790 [Encephalitozoon intestinalis]
MTFFPVQDRVMALSPKPKPGVREIREQKGETEHGLG